MILQLLCSLSDSNLWEEGKTASKFISRDMEDATCISHTTIVYKLFCLKFIIVKIFKSLRTIFVDTNVNTLFLRLLTLLAAFSIVWLHASPPTLFLTSFVFRHCSHSRYTVLQVGSFFYWIGDVTNLTGHNKTSYLVRTGMVLNGHISY